MFIRLVTALSFVALQAQAETPTVATDIAPVHSLVSRVMSGVGEPMSVMPQGASPHGYSLRPSEARTLSQADLVIWMGEDLTPWLEDAIENLAPDAKSLELLHLTETHVLETRTEAVFEDHNDDYANEEDHHADEHGDHGDHGDDHKDEDGHDEHAEDHEDDHGHGHYHDGHDPHAWLDPENAVIWLTSIAAALSELDPANAELYAMNAKVAATEIEAVAEDSRRLLAPLQDRRFVVFHDAYQYFEHAFDLNALGALQLSDATPPSAARLVHLRDEIAEHGVVCVFAEPQFNPELIASVAPEGTNTGTLDPLGTQLPMGPSFYTLLLRDLTERVANCLS
ncbi:zinc ABC transporter substrate-binding protein [Cognatishimia maritima]|uniref:High-affinity zinc uptake system protein ZnuA n=1 Tax=Cognatishimia maritima TaxID=870908 RepID=A0A1M5T6K3_9RHOB|nr:zinc ABC transporter substrate-binding protein [Cognatishimia maritima]SHH46230.1 zinc transport system substrate-binding protein [Cognatishimia maritima]